MRPSCFCNGNCYAGKTSLFSLTSRALSHILIDLFIYQNIFIQDNIFSSTIYNVLQYGPVTIGKT